jgi:hypothetical protein
LLFGAKRYAAGETMAERDYECGEATIWRVLRPFGSAGVAA